MNDSLRVLLLEDEPLISMDMEFTLKCEGYAVTTIRSCAEAALWLESNLPDVAIIDIMLSDGPCHDAVEKLSQAGIPFVVHSGDRPAMYAGTAFEHGTWLSKPAAETELLENVRKAAAGL